MSFSAHRISDARSNFWGFSINCCWKKIVDWYLDGFDLVNSKGKSTVWVLTRIETDFDTSVHQCSGARLMIGLLERLAKIRNWDWPMMDAIQRVVNAEIDFGYWRILEILARFVFYGQSGFKCKMVLNDNAFSGRIKTIGILMVFVEPVVLT